MLLETMLQWSAWLNSNEMKKSDVERSKKKHRCIMHLVRKVAIRVQGMGLKLMKFHAILRMSKDIMNFGVPLEHDTGCNESHHIDTKKASQLTQRDLNKVEEQTAERLLEMEVLALTQAEIGGKWLCDYSLSHAPAQPNCAEMPHKTRTPLGGAVCWVTKNAETGNLAMKADRSNANKALFPMVEVDLSEFTFGLQVVVNQHASESPLHSCYTGNGHIFRGDVSYRKSIWRDWVVINWGADGSLPNRIYGFVDLTLLPDHLQGAKWIAYGGLRNVKPGTHAIVEATIEGCEGVEPTELFDALSMC